MSHLEKTAKKSLLMRAIRGEEVEHVPVWLMRQAGRYLPEFRAVRAKNGFFKICQTPELATEVTMQPLKRFDLDAAIIFSDILVIPQALGMKVEMKQGVGPVLPDPLLLPENIANLNWPLNVSDSLGYVYDAIKMTVEKINGEVPLIGFCGGPWTLFTYMTEGGSSKTMATAKKWLYVWPEPSKYLLSVITSVVIDHLVAQAKAGAEVLQVFESHAEYLSHDLFKNFSLPYLKEIAKKTKEQIDVPMIIFAKGCHYAIPELSESGYDVVGLDWTIDPEKARSESGGSITLQGNLDPCALFAPEEKIKEMATNMVKKFGKTNYIANLGHGVYPDTNPEKIKIFIDAIHSA